MEFKQLRSFVEVVRQGSFTQAAVRLHASQSAVSKQVAQLEQSLQVQLLERSGPHVRLTAAGEVVLRRAEDMLRLRRELLTELDDLSQMKRGELRLGLPLLGADALFAWRFAEYRKRYPHIQVHLVEGGSKSLEQAVHAGELELAGALTPATPASTGSGSATNRWTPCCRPNTRWPGASASPWPSWPTPRSCSTSRASPSTTACCAPATRPASNPARAAAAARPTSSARWSPPARAWCCCHGRWPRKWYGQGWHGCC